MNQPHTYDDIAEEPKTAMITLQAQLIWSSILSLPFANSRYTVSKDARDIQDWAFILKTSTMDLQSDLIIGQDLSHKFAKFERVQTTSHGMGYLPLRAYLEGS